MTTYYVSKSGSDSNNGQGPDASHASNKPWLTVGKALGASGIASGDTVYICSGIYREIVSIAMTSPTAETKVVGDVANSQGFKDGSGNLLASGPVIWTAYTTDDHTAPSGTTLLNLNTRDHLTFQNLLFVGGTAVIVTAGAVSTDILFQDCAFLMPQSQNIMTVTGAADTALNWTLDRCFFQRGNARRADTHDAVATESHGGQGVSDVWPCHTRRRADLRAVLPRAGAGVRSPI